MPYEDFSTYTEVDEDGDITVTPSKCDVASIRRDALSYVRDDKGANHFTDFEHLVTIYNALGPISYPSCGLWALSNGSSTIQAMLDADEGLVLWISGSAPDAYHTIKDLTNDNEDSYAYAGAKLLYCTIDRTSTTLTAKLYSDAERTDLIDTIFLTCGTLAYRYVFGVASRQAVSNPDWNITGYSENLDLQEELPPTSYGYIM